MSDSTIEMVRGQKHVYGIPQNDGRVRFITDCYHTGALVEVFVTKAQAEEIVQRSRCIQEIIPEVPRELREIFVSGQTPAEFDHTFGRKVKKKYPGYVDPDSE